MPLVPCKCTNCGAILKVDNTKDAAICAYCGSAFIVEKAINNYTVTNNITAEVVNVFGSNSADFVIRGGILQKYNGAATDVIIPNNVKVIGEKAFESCYAVNSVIIPDSVYEIEKSAFENCSKLTNVTIGNEVTSIGDYAFKNCSSLLSITLPGKVYKIGTAAFSGCTSLIRIALGRVKIICISAFEGCTNLRGISIPESTTAIVEGTFARCTSLSSIVLPESITTIGGFEGCINLRGINLPENLTEIGPKAFKGCINLRGINLPENLTEIGSKAFEGCTNLSGITLPKNLTEIGSEAFKGCTNISGINFPENLTEIGSGAFEGCTGLRSITLPKKIKKIEGFAFSDCTNLSEVIIPFSDHDINLKWHVFYRCTNLRSIHIPDNVTTQKEGIEGIYYTDDSFYIFPDWTHINASRTWKSTNWKSSKTLSNYKPREGCYIATCVYGSYDCPEVWTLRRFRDATLASTWYGRTFIRIYYAVSPTLVKWFGNTASFRRLFKDPLDKLVARLKRQGVADTPYKDRYI